MTALTNMIVLSLEDGRLDAKRGDFIRLWYSTGEGKYKFRMVGGHVVNLDFKTVTLSHEHPDEEFYAKSLRRILFGRGDRPYRLSDYTDYEIFPEKKEERAGD